MYPVCRHIESLLVRDLDGIKREIEAFPDEGMIWETPPGISNPAGTLALHVCGNLNHYIGSILGGTSYERDRAAEFSKRSISREDIYRMVDGTRIMLKTVIPGIDVSVLASRYPERVGGFNLNTEQFLIHLCTHLSLHLGQVGYLRRILTGRPHSTGPASLKAIRLAE